MVLTGFDADQDCSPVALLAFRRGAVFVCRYLKNLTQEEAKALTVAGLNIVTIFETTARRALGGAAAGKEDGQRALAQAQALGQPTGSAIYATADFGETEDQNAAVLAYLDAFDGQISGYSLGVYGEGAVCQAALDAKIAKYVWLAGGMGMRGSRDFLQTGLATIVQDVGDAAGLALGIDIDSDTAYTNDYGGWKAAQNGG